MYRMSAPSHDDHTDHGDHTDDGDHVVAGPSRKWWAPLVGFIFAAAIVTGVGFAAAAAYETDAEREAKYAEEHSEDGEHGDKDEHGEEHSEDGDDHDE